MGGILSDEDKKKAVFDAMSSRRQAHIQKKIGYDNWNPFEKPKDPIDIRRDKSNRTAQMLVQDFMKAHPKEGDSKSYRRGVLEMAVGIVNDDDRYQAMYAFALWHKQLLEKEGIN